MHVHYVPHEQVRAYLVELGKRLQAMGAAAPQTWVPIGRSGKDLLDVFSTVCPAELKKSIGVVDVTANTS